MYINRQTNKAALTPHGAGTASTRQPKACDQDTACSAPSAARQSDRDNIILNPTQRGVTGDSKLSQRSSGGWSWKAAVCFLCSFDSFHAAGDALIGRLPWLLRRWPWLAVAVEEVLLVERSGNAPKRHLALLAPGPPCLHTLPLSATLQPGASLSSPATKPLSSSKLHGRRAPLIDSTARTCCLLEPPSRRFPLRLHLDSSSTFCSILPQCAP
jgi:hypothetical protein